MAQGGQGQGHGGGQGNSGKGSGGGQRVVNRRELHPAIIEIHVKPKKIVRR